MTYNGHIENVPEKGQFLNSLRHVAKFNSLVVWGGGGKPKTARVENVVNLVSDM